MLQVQNIEKYYGSKNNVTKALDRVSFDVEAGEFLAIMGPSGSGKTTLLNCISTIDTISAGEILLDGVSIAGLSEGELAKFRRERLGFVFQDFNLLDTLTIEENIGLALSLNHQNPGTVQNRVREVAGKLGITNILTKFPYQVSGGQKQRVAIARMLLQNAPVMVFDDSLSAVDAETDARIRAALKQRMSDATVILISHRVTSLMQADRILVLDGGRVADVGSHAELISRPGIYREIYDIQMSSDDRALIEKGGEA